MLENLHFTYDGKSSKDFGVVLVNPSGGLYKEQFLPNRKIVETTVAGRFSPFLQRVDSDPLSFSLHIYLDGWEERNNLRQISRWLYQDYYKPLIFESNPDVIYYAMIEGKSELTHNGLFQGYISLTVRLNSPYCYSRVHEKFENVLSVSIIDIHNDGDLPMRINMDIKKTLLDGGVSVSNYVNDQFFRIDNVLIGEEIIVDSENEIITSSLENTGRFLMNNHNDQWIELEPVSSVKLYFTGAYEVTLKYQYRYLNTDIELIGKVGGSC